MLHDIIRKNKGLFLTTAFYFCSCKKEVDILDNTYMFENYISIGRSFVAEKNYLKALKFLKKAYACPEGKDDIDLILDLAFLYDKIADFNSAEKMYKMALDIDNTCAIAYYGLGIIYDDDELYEEAIECYKNAIENDNKYMWYIGPINWTIDRAYTIIKITIIRYAF